jgi:predicted DNA binding CopG/RHH family protein
MNKPPVYPGDPGFVYHDDEERELIEGIESADWKPLNGQALDDVRARLCEAARTTKEELATKTERMNIRMTPGDMDALKGVAAREGLPYQSLVTSILHKFISGRLVDIDEARKLLKGA